MGSIPGSERPPWRRKWEPTPVFLPGKSHGQRSLAGYSPWGCRRVRHDLVTEQLQHKVRGWGESKLFSVQFSRSVTSDSLWPHEPQLARPPFPSPTPGVYPNSCLWVGDAIQPSHPLSPPSPPLSPPSPPVLNLSQHQGLFKWVSSPHQMAQVLGVSASISVLPMNTQYWTPRSPRDCQNSSLSPQSKSTNSLLFFVFGPTLTSVSATGKTIALTLGTLVCKVMPLL